MHRSRLLVFLAFFCIGDWAFALGTARIGGPLIDSESKDGVWFSPSAELRFEQSTDDKIWKAAAQVKIQNSKIAPNQTTPAKLETSISEASIGRFTESLHARVGRLPVRPISVSLNEASRIFMRSAIAIDGLEISYLAGNAEFGAFGGATKSLGLRLATRRAGLQAGAVYRFQKEKIVSFPQVIESGAIVEGQRVTASHEAEITLKVPGESIQAESVFQFFREGPYTSVDVLDAGRGEYITGSQDRALPNEANEYRATGQVKFRVDEGEQQSDWAIFAISSVTSPRYHHGTPEEKLFRQGAGADLRVIGGYEKQTPEFVAQVCLHGDYSTSQKYRLFSKRNNSGEPVFEKTKFGVTVMTSFNF